MVIYQRDPSNRGSSDRWMTGLEFGLGFSVLRDPKAAGTPESVGTWRWGGG
jgi:hypothetical protein